MIVKICGITTLEDALVAVEAGAQMLGFNFYPASPRYIRPEVCRQIMEALRGSSVVGVGVFVNADVEEIRRVLQMCRLDLAQLSGDEPPEHLRELGGCAYKALRPATEQALETALQHYPPRREPPAFLLDAYHPAHYGGSGQRVPLDLAAGLARRFPILLAGGLKPENVASVVESVRPYGVDVASGVESAPGKKDAERLRAFIRAARGAVQKQIAD